MQHQGRVTKWFVKSHKREKKAVWLRTLANFYYPRMMQVRHGRLSKGLSRQNTSIRPVSIPTSTVHPELGVTGDC